MTHPRAAELARTRILLVKAILKAMKGKCK
jgi:hypothetical protein